MNSTAFYDYCEPVLTTPVGTLYRCWNDPVPVPPIPGPDIPEIGLDAPPGSDLPGNELPGDATEGVGEGTQVESQARADAVPEPCTADCPRCPPHIEGAVDDEPYNSTRPEHRNGYRYQYYVNQMHGVGPAFPISERGPGSSIGVWKWNEKRFDGLVFFECMLLEAKHGYGNFLEGGYEGFPARMKDWTGPANVMIFEDWVAEAAVFEGFMAAHDPMVHCTWCFSDILTKIYMFTRLAPFPHNYSLHLPYVS